MKTLGLMALAFVVFYVVKKANPKFYISYDQNPVGLNLMLDNEQNKQGFPVGTPRDFEQSFEKFRTLTEAELLKMLEEESLNLHEVSNALVLLANTYFQEKNIAKGLPLLKVSAYDYHNPLAMVTLGRAYFHGFSVEEGEAPVKDLKEAYYLVNRAFQTAGLLHEKTGQKFALDKSVAMGLALLDSYNLHEVKKEFNPQEHSTELGDKIQADLEAFKSMYSIQ